MSTHEAINLLRRQLDEHIAAIGEADDPAVQAVLYRNLASHFKGWNRILEKEAVKCDVQTLTQVKRKRVRLESAA